MRHTLIVLAFLLLFAPTAAMTDPFAEDPFAETGPAGPGADVPLITFTAREISVHDALSTVCEVAGLKWSFRHSVVMIESNEKEKDPGK